MRACVRVRVCACVCECTNKLHLEALVTIFHFVGKSNISRHMPKIHTHDEHDSTVRHDWDKKYSQTCTFHVRSAYIGLYLLLLTECCLVGMRNHQMNCHLEMV